MNYLKPTFYLFFFITIFISSCTSSDDDKMYGQLGENQAKAIYKIDGKEFYPPESIFKGEVSVSDKLLSITLIDQFDGRSIVSYGGDDWYLSIPSKKDVFSNDQVNAGVKMGKLTDREKMVGEGMILSEGTVTLQEFSKDKIVIKIQGKVGKYSDFEQPTEFKNFDGTVVYKKPAFNLLNITEEELFSAIKSPN
ncbi:hypothetical protein L0657_10765 [Dyadobacter sp. CY345]|uniref:hypothetical protein n=1 Tax=Dyadobacter sp. CY345 TaxID=2909335 RepID=UPI001F23FE0D|nr:hypothetical protein [Dyadobacter sp. CY345]MCF2444437.1 hypothetical protein [Dyadobacter sp. CY345]